MYRTDKEITKSQIQKIKERIKDLTQQLHSLAPNQHDAQLSIIEQRMKAQLELKLTQERYQQQELGRQHRIQSNEAERRNKNLKKIKQ